MSYADFIAKRRFVDIKSGFHVDDLTESLKAHQKYLVRWALLKGRCAIFADTGLGKSRMMCEWGRHISGRVLFLSPLAVANQTVEEACHVGLDLKYSRYDSGEQFIITNYEMIDKFDMSLFTGVVLDESSILKNFDGRLRSKITTMCANVPYKLSCSATPSPNDHMELGCQSEFLGVMPRAEMLAMFFQHDSSSTSNWVLKGHGRSKFWEWLSTWAAVIRSPEDIGLDGSEYKLPGLNIQYHELDSNLPLANTLTERRIAKRESLTERVEYAAMLANYSDGPVLVWCHLNDESVLLKQSIFDAIEVCGSDSIDKKESNLIAFSNNNARVLVTKPSIAGFGMNWQHCNTMIFVGLNDSYEQFYQAIRRCYRFGQTREVTVHCILTTAERQVIENLQRKECQHEELSNELTIHMAKHVEREVIGTFREYSDYQPLNQIKINHELFKSSARS